MSNEFTDRERYLIKIFGKFCEDFFQHDDATIDDSLVDSAILCAFDAVHAAGLLAENEFGHELAAEYCRRAVHWRRLAMELEQFLNVSTPADLEALKTVQRLNYRDELRAKWGEPKSVRAAAQTEARVNDPPSKQPEQPEQPSTIRISLTNATVEPADNPWTTLLNLESQFREMRRHIDCVYLNGRDATEENAASRQILESEHLATVEGFQALELHTDSLFAWLRDNEVPSPGLQQAREAIARGREIREALS